MFRLIAGSVLTAFVALCAACGGANGAPAGDGTPLLQTSSARPDPSLFANAPARVVAAAQRQAVSAAGDPRIATVMNWAETVLPQLFPGAAAEQQVADFTYRYYAKTQNYIGISQGNVYVQGAATGQNLLLVGTVSDLWCRATATNCFGKPAPGDMAAGCAPQAITCVRLASTSTSTQTLVPVTFGQPFKAGDLPAGTFLEARDSTGTPVTVQMDEVSTHADGSVRFAVLSAQVAGLKPGEQRVVNLFKATTAPPAPGGVSLPASYDMKLTAMVYSPQITRITFGNRSGTTAGVPFVAGEVITLQLGSTSVEQFTLAVTADQAGGGFQTLAKIAEAFMAQINASSKAYRASKYGEGGGYEWLWISPVANDAPAFNVKFVYAGNAKLSATNLQNYQAPRQYTVDARAALDKAIASTTQTPRLNGTVAREYALAVPFTDATGAKHPQLMARLYSRLYEAGRRVRTDVALENNWTYDPSPGNLMYEFTVSQNGQTVLRQPTFTHNHHARWHKVLWTGDAPQVELRHYMPYFLDSRATWNYDLTLAVPESVLSTEAGNLAKADTSPMGAAFVLPYFPTTGGRQDIGPLPRWTALFLVTQDARARASMLANADAAGSVPIHYRDSTTDQPVSLETHPGLAMVIGTSTAQDALPTVSNDATIWSPDISHQPSFSYIPYMVTGDAYYLDETLFWANWNMGKINPGYRGGGQGLIHDEQMRGQAWALRTLGEAARALPDRHAMKSYFQRKLNDNLAWYVQQYPRNTSGTVSPMGMMEKADAIGQTAPWQNDFMALVAGQLAETGDAAAIEYANWITRFTVGRTTHEGAGFCRAQAPAYYIAIRDSSNRFITDWSQLYKANWPNVLACNPAATLDGGPGSPSGYAAYIRAMLGTSVSLGVNGADGALTYWRSATKAMDNAMLSDPTWAIVPRQ